MEPDGNGGFATVPTARQEQRRIKTYDFRRPDKFSRDQIRTMSILHETFARQVTAALSAQLRSLVHLHVASVDQLTYEEFIRSIPNPSTVAIVSMDPLRGSAVLEIDPALTFSIYERLCGGHGGTMTPARELTDIESSVLESVIPWMLACLPGAWAAVTDLRPRLAGIECNPMFAQVVPPSEMVVLVTLEGQVGDARGMVNFCIPYLTIRPVIPRLSPNYVFSNQRFASREDPVLAVSSLPMTAEVCYEGDRLTLHALASLKKGAMIGLPGYGEGNAFLQAGHAPFVRLAVRRARNAHGAYAFSDQRMGKDLEILRAIRNETAEMKENTLHDAMRALSSELGAALKTMEGRIADLARRQEEIADQLIFESPDKEVVPGGRHPGSKRPFGALTISDCDVLATFIGQEHPQLIAMVLSYLEPGISACVLARTAEDLRVDVLERICAIDRVSPGVLRDVERVLEKKLSVLSSEEYAAAGGVETAVDILNTASRALEKGVVEALEKSNRRLADEIRKRMFLFEDVARLDPETMTAVLKEVEEGDLLVAVKATSEEVRAFIWRCLPPADAERLKTRLEKTGRTRLKDVEEAQQRIVGVIRAMEEEGKIVPARPDELTR
jgi:flagellar motor switch protein FliM